MKFSTDIYGLETMNVNDFGDSLKCVLKLLAGQKCHFSSKISQHLQHGWAQNLYIHGP